MNRTGHTSAKFFLGTEVERTCYFGKRTLFVVGIANWETILEQAKTNNCEHVFFGANDSFKPSVENLEQWRLQLYMTSLDYRVSLDCGIEYLDWTKSFGSVRSLCLQIKVPIANIEQLPTSTVYLKLDDIDFAKTNPGVWTARLDTIKSEQNFTNWDAYQSDKVLQA